MPRPQKTPENTGLMPWPEVGRRVGLTEQQARREGERALRKLRAYLEVLGIDQATFVSIIRTRERETQYRNDRLYAIVESDGPA